MLLASRDILSPISSIARNYQRNPLSCMNRVMQVTRCLCLYVQRQRREDLVQTHPPARTKAATMKTHRHLRDRRWKLWRARTRARVYGQTRSRPYTPEEEYGVNDNEDGHVIARDLRRPVPRASRARSCTGRETVKRAHGRTSPAAPAPRWHRHRGSRAKKVAWTAWRDSTRRDRPRQPATRAFTATSARFAPPE